MYWLSVYLKYRFIIQKKVRIDIQYIIKLTSAGKKDFNLVEIIYAFPSKFFKNLPLLALAALLLFSQCCH